MPRKAQAADRQLVAAPDNPVGAQLHPALQQSLVFDIALGTGTDAILEAYDLQRHQLDRIMGQPLFRAELARVKKQLSEEGATFRLKAQVQAEQMLDETWVMVHDRESVPAHVRADLIKATARWAGYEIKSVDGGSGASGAQFTLNMNFSGDNQGRETLTIQAEPDTDGDA